MLTRHLNARRRNASGCAPAARLALTLVLLPLLVPATVSAQLVSGREETLHRANGTYPVLSPDGRFLVYSAGAGFDRDLHLVDLSTGAVRLLTDTPDEDSAADWAPDGNRLVFQRETSDGNRDVWIVEHDGTGARPIRYTPDVREQHPRFSPDGRSIVFDCNCDDMGRPAGNEDYDVHRIDLASGRAETLVDGAYWDMYPSLSPDGQLLAWRRETRDAEGARHFEIVVRDIGTGSELVMTPGGAGGTSPHFSPREGWLVFTADRGEGSQIYRVDPRDPVVELVTGAVEGASYTRPTVVADGSAVIATRRIGSAIDLVRIPTPPRRTNRDLPARADTVSIGPSG